MEHVEKGRVTIGPCFSCRLFTTYSSSEKDFCNHNKFPIIGNVLGPGGRLDLDRNLNLDLANKRDAKNTKTNHHISSIDEFLAKEMRQRNGPGVVMKGLSRIMGERRY